MGEVGRVYQDYLLDLKNFVEPTPTGFILIIGSETGFLSWRRVKFCFRLWPVSGR
ncbi:hypothetical protein L2E73_08630 [Planktothrix agardhii 1030]|nr:hypothetical protein [Planktothrix agardhii 1030]